MCSLYVGTLTAVQTFVLYPHHYDHEVLHEVVLHLSRFGFNFADLPLLGSCTLIALKHLMVVSSMWPIGPLVHVTFCKESQFEYQIKY